MLKPTSPTLLRGKTDPVLTVSNEVAAAKYGQTWTQLNYGENTMVYIPYGIHTICCVSIFIQNSWVKLFASTKFIEYLLL